MKILYLHGFGSSHASGTVELLRQHLPTDDIVAPDIPTDPAEALPYLLDYAAAEAPDLIVGTSMGGMYAQQLRGYRRILVNPAFNMSTMSQVLRTGEHRFFNGRYDGQKTFRITRDIIQRHNMMERQQFKDIPEQDKTLVWGLFATRDVAPKNYDLFKKHFPADHALRFEGDHQLNDRAVRTALLPLIAQLREEIAAATTE